MQELDKVLDKSKTGKTGDPEGIARKLFKIIITYQNLLEPPLNHDEFI